MIGFAGIRNDGLDDLTGVNQGGLLRSFNYSSLKRLTSATNPESGTIFYGYDRNGNVLSRADARVTMSVSGYDALNRPVSRSYTPSTTPPVTYTYDTCAYGKPRLCGVASSASSAGYGYDELGRVKQATQTTGSAYTTNYSYNLAGGLASVEYPGSTVTTPRKVSYEYNTSGQVIAVYRGAVGSGDKYVQAVAYWPGGAEKAVTLGNGVLEETSLNARLQMSGRTAKLGTNTLWGVAYGFSGTTNNGNPLSQTVSGPNPFTQDYWYDPLNRLQAVKDSLMGVASPAPAAPAGVGAATQVFAYDRYGNRALVSSSFNAGGAPVASLSGTPTVAQLAAEAATKFTGNRTNGMAHDGSGNMTNLGGTSTYDAENRLATATYVPDATMPGSVWTLRHTYDGEGRRVKTERVKPDTTVDTTTVYVYGGAGELVQEYGPAGSTTGRTYLTADHLGSTRLVTTAAGPTPVTAANANEYVASRHDYLPFGEEIARGAGFGGGPTLKFTSKERDAETGLDYFGARYMSAAQGRFTSPDAPFADQNPADPQSWNLFSYVRNNPLRFVDPTGQYLVSCANGVTNCATEQASFEAARQAALQSKDAGIKRGASAYGNPGADNGVNVSITTVVDPNDKNVRGTVGATPNTGGFTVGADGKTVKQATDVTIQAAMTGNDLQSVAIHEGVHVADRADFVASISIGMLPKGHDPQNPNLEVPFFNSNSALNITREQSERNAYGAQNVFLRSIGASTVNINRTLSRPPYSNTNLKQRLFPAVP